MTPLLEESKRLLRLALRDQETFSLLLPLPKANLAALGFLAQQSIEKALKAVAILSGLEQRRTHDLTALALQIEAKQIALPVPVDALRRLNPFAVEFRYDDEVIPTMSRDEIESVLSTTLRWAQERVDEATPQQDVDGEPR